MHGSPGVQPSETFAPGRILAAGIFPFTVGGGEGVTMGDGAGVDVAASASEVATGTVEEVVVEGAAGAGSTGERATADDDEEDDGGAGTEDTEVTEVLSVKTGVCGLATGW